MPGLRNHYNLLPGGSRPTKPGHVELGKGGEGVTGRQHLVNSEWRWDQTMPRSMTRAEIRTLVGEFAAAARNAKEAGFDGVQIQGNFVYVVAQFLHTAINLRADESGGAVDNRARLLFDTLDAVLAAMGGKHVALKVGPTTDAVGPMAANADTIATFDYILKRLDTYDLAHVLVSGLAMDVSNTSIASLAGDQIFLHVRQFYKGTLMANGDFDLVRANRIIGTGVADLVAFGRPYISDPDLVERLRDGLPLTPPDVATIYRGRSGPSDGYTDYTAAHKS